METVAIDALLPAESPRGAGENQDHVRALAETAVTLPPILVDRRTMRVVDGMHRLRAASLRGERQIEVEYFDGTTNEAFLRAVQENVSHGLPLSRADREAAVIRVLRDFPELSDRAIASACGVSNKTVGVIRARSTAHGHQLQHRTGLDGRVRPVNSVDGRLAAQAVIHSRPDASLREIAREAGVSLNTARDVRARMRDGRDPVPAGLPRPTDKASSRKSASTAAGNRVEIGINGTLMNMKQDPSLRFTDAGRRLLRWLDVHVAQVDSWQDLIVVIPPYHVDSVAVLARECARVWEAIAETLENNGVAADVDRSTGIT